MFWFDDENKSNQQQWATHKRVRWPGKKPGRRSDGGNMLIMIVLTVGGAGHNDHQTQAIISDINWAISRAQLCQECATMRDIARTSAWSIVTRVDNEEVFVSLALTDSDWNLWNVLRQVWLMIVLCCDKRGIYTFNLKHTTNSYRKLLLKFVKKWFLKRQRRQGFRF